MGFRSVSVLLLGGLGCMSCQAVLGDFEVSDVEARPLGTACAPNSFRCQEQRLQRCRPDRTGFDLFETCESADLCDPTAGACRACTPNEFACSDGELRTCGATGGWVNPTTCETAALCRTNPARTEGQCAAPTCDAGAFTCDDGWLLSCAATRDRWDLVEYCGTDDRCDAAAAANAVALGERPHCASVACPEDGCPVSACTPGATRCSSVIPVVELCSTNGEWIIREVCGSLELCDGRNGRCLPRACNLGDTRCVGRVRQTCAQDLTRFEDVETCPAAGTCAPDGCEPAKCTDDTKRCNGVAFETCVSGEFVATNRCATRALCDPMSGCETPTCDLGEATCSPEGMLTTCLPTRDGQRVNDCPDDTVCNERAGRCL